MIFLGFMTFSFIFCSFVLLIALLWMVPSGYFTMADTQGFTGGIGRTEVRDRVHGHWESTGWLLAAKFALRCRAALADLFSCSSRVLCV